MVEVEIPPPGFKMPAGRPTQYKESFAEKAYKFCAEFGFSDKALGKVFDVCEKTINTWKQAHPEFLQSIKRGKDDYDSEKVENSLLKRALGYKYNETTKEISPVANVKTGKPYLRETKRVRKEVAPETTAQIFWLKNRQPDRWRDRTEMQHGGVIHLYTQPMKIPKDAGT